MSNVQVDIYAIDVNLFKFKPQKSMLLFNLFLIIRQFIRTYPACPTYKTIYVKKVYIPTNNQLSWFGLTAELMRRSP